MVNYPWIEFLLAAYLGISGTRKRSLSPSGGITAFIVGFLMMAVPLRSFGVSLIIFYLFGSKATKVGKESKARLEEGHQEAGYRNSAQVLCNSFSAFVASVLWTASYVTESSVSTLLSGLVPHSMAYDSAEWCAISSSSSGSWSRALVFIALGHFSCCLGDTLASELGILSKSPPRLITTGAVVPPGTNGGVSVVGTVASVAGGLVMGLTLAVTLYIESSACRQDMSGLIQLIGWGAFAGLIGSLLDSFLGATIQRTKFSSKTNRIMTDESSSPVKETEVQIISGLDILTNNQVNLVSSIVTSLALGWIA